MRKRILSSELTVVLVLRVYSFKHYVFILLRITTATVEKNKKKIILFLARSKTETYFGIVSKF